MANLSSKIYNGLLPISAGGTGATTAAAALTALGAHPTLTSGTNIVTINSTSLLGSGNLAISALTPTAIQTSLYTAAAYDLVRCNSSGGIFSINLPPNPTDGTLVGFLDVTGNFAAFPVTLLPNGASRNIEGDTASLSLNINNAYVTFIYSSTANSWKLTENPSSSYSTTPDVPGVPTSVSATILETTATVTFNVPSYVGGSTITSYTATSSPGGIVGTKFGIVNQSGTDTITVYNLLPSVSYTFTVTATNGAGTGIASTASNSVLTTVPGAPTIGTVTVSGTTATVQFTAPLSNGNSIITKYTATSYPLLVTGNLTGIVNQAGNGSIQVNNLLYNTSYTFTVTATNAYGTSAASNPSNSVLITVPGAPTIGTATMISETSATVTFTAPVSSGGTDIIQYIATASSGRVTGNLTGIQSQTGIGSVTVTGLLPNINYTFTVQAVNAAGTGPASAASNVVTTVSITNTTITANLTINKAWIVATSNWNGTTTPYAIKIINSADIYSATNSTAALIFASDLGTLPGSVKPIFINYSVIAGKGGTGAQWGQTTSSTQNGGPAIQVLAPVSIINNGIVGGGGGGGGAYWGSGGGGWGGGTGGPGGLTGEQGGGGGGGAGIGGAGGSANSTGGSAGSAGSTSFLGAGGRGSIYYASINGGAGGATLGGGGGCGGNTLSNNPGAGGALGQPGSNSVTPSGAGGGGSAGAAGGSAVYSTPSLHLGGQPGVALIGLSYVNSGTGLGTAATIGAAVTQGTYYGLQN